MMEQPIRTDPGGVAKVVGALGKMASSFMDPMQEHFEKKAEKQTAEYNKNVSAAQNSEHLANVGKLLDQSAAHDLAMVREKGRQRRITTSNAVRQMGKLPAAPGTKTKVELGRKGGVAAEYTQTRQPAATAKPSASGAKAPAARVSRASASAAKSSSKPAATKAAPKATSPANPSRRGKK
jgi:hypothetical protein